MTHVQTTARSVTSRDGTTIAYRVVGGPGPRPGVVLLHGAMQAGPSNVELARALAGAYTCYVPDRRGRGASGPCGAGYGLQREVEDLDALLTATGARDVIGVSSGAVIALSTALARPDLRRVVAFEPPLNLGDTDPTGLLERFDREIAEGRVARALVTGMLAAHLGPPVLQVLPRWLLERLTTAFMARQERQGAGEEPRFRELAPTLHYDIRLVTEAIGSLERLRGVRAEVLLMGGSRSAAPIKRALTALEGLLPHARRVELRGLGHEATCNTAMGGRPGRVAEEVSRFLT
ncbi:alpha/beta fold hydrolase [Nonomuraea lactucae]|uniref:alpha/beta fold hydrolase n=1 Tax=Nonomuraea lactucae TaxID=2249762 RepID=UPI000DE42E22|nr:alpha/beta hydrolase [Nonomuraea lactucae]